MFSVLFSRILINFFFLVVIMKKETKKNVSRFSTTPFHRNPKKTRYSLFSTKSKTTEGHMCKKVFPTPHTHVTIHLSRYQTSTISVYFEKVVLFYVRIKNYAPAEEIRVKYRRESGNGCLLRFT